MLRNITLWGHHYVVVLPLDSLHQFLWFQQEGSNLAFTAFPLCRVMEYEVVGRWIYFPLGLRHEAPALVQLSWLVALDTWLLIELLVGVVLSWSTSLLGAQVGHLPVPQQRGQRPRWTCRHWVLCDPCIWSVQIGTQSWGSCREGVCYHCKSSTTAEFAFGESFFAASSEHSCWFPLLKETVRLPFPPWCMQTPCSSAEAQAGSPKQMVLFYAQPAPLPKADSRHMHSHQMI